MRAEHAEIEAMISATLRARDVVSARGACLRLIDFLTDHCRREEMLLFPMSEGLGDTVLEELGERWKERRFA